MADSLIAVDSSAVAPAAVVVVAVVVELVNSSVVVVVSVVDSLADMDLADSVAVGFVAADADTRKASIVAVVVAAAVVVAQDNFDVGDNLQFEDFDNWVLVMVGDKMDYVHQLTDYSHRFDNDWDEGMVVGAEKNMKQKRLQNEIRAWGSCV